MKRRFFRKPLSVQREELAEIILKAEGRLIKDITRLSDLKTKLIWLDCSIETLSTDSVPQLKVAKSSIDLSGLTLKEAAIKVLTKIERPMSVLEIAEKIVAWGYTTRGGQVSPLQIRDKLYTILANSQVFKRIPMGKYQINPE